jgi:polysaccharide pyruvyl transferase WcaK-like protein
MKSVTTLRTPAPPDAMNDEPAAPRGDGPRAAAAERTIAFFGNFGTQNLGNEYTLAAILHNARRLRPDTPLLCICPDPEDASQRHDVPATRISYRYAARRRVPGSRLVRLLRRLFVRVPRELAEIVRAYRTLDGVGMLVMTGTGMLSDFGIGAFDLHAEILKYALLARLRGVRLAFVSVGAGPIANPVSRFIVKRALALADYRSYRDRASREWLAREGFDSSRDPVYPDLAFSLPPAVRALQPRKRRAVGVGLMDYYGTRTSPRTGEAAYLAYVSKMAGFVRSLIEGGHEVHLLIGDVSYDTRAKRDLVRIFREWGFEPPPELLVDVHIHSVEQLIDAIGKTDLVVATRFHTVLLGLMLEKPVLALSYHVKTASLMESVGLPQLCHDLDRQDLETLLRQFAALEQAAGTIPPHLARKSADCRRALEEQYAILFGSG